MPARKLSKEIIVNEAIAQISETERPEISIREIARRLDVKAPSLYNHIENLTELQHAVYRYAIDAFVENQKDAVRGMSGDEALTSFAEAYHSFAMENRGLYILIMSIPSENDDAGNRIALPLLDLIVSILSEYGLDGIAVAHWQRVFRALLHGFVSQEYLGYFYHYGDADVGESRRIAVRCFLDGLHAAVDRADGGI